MNEKSIPTQKSRIIKAAVKSDPICYMRIDNILSRQAFSNKKVINNISVINQLQNVLLNAIDILNFNMIQLV